jgi:hypothetical protein
MIIGIGGLVKRGGPSRKLRKRSRNVNSVAKECPNARGHAGADVLSLVKQLNLKILE